MTAALRNSSISVHRNQLYITLSFLYDNRRLIVSTLTFHARQFTDNAIGKYSTMQIKFSSFDVESNGDATRISLGSRCNQTYSVENP